MKTWILGLWIAGYSMGAQAVVEWDAKAMKPVYKSERLELFSNGLNTTPQEPPQVVQPVRMGKMNFTVAKVIFTKDAEGRIIASVERTSCVGTTEAPIYDVRDLDNYAIEYRSHSCIAVIYGKKTRLNIQGYIILDKNLEGRATTHFVGGLSYMVPAVRPSPADYNYGYTGFSTKSEIRDGTFAIYPEPKVDITKEKKVEAFTANVELVDEQ